MIIKYPTASYLSIIPQTESDGGNVTFTISTQSPPRDITITSQLPAAIEQRVRSIILITYPADARRVLTVTQSNAATIGSSKKQFESGQVLEFIVGQPSTVQPMLVSKSLEVRHDTNVLDLLSLGVSQVDSDYIGSLASLQFTNLNAELNVTKQARIDTETAIVENQKNQNEAKKAISALEQLISFDASLQQTLESLRGKLVELTSQAELLITTANEQANNASAVSNQILAVAQMVR